MEPRPPQSSKSSNPDTLTSKRPLGSLLPLASSLKPRPKISFIDAPEAKAPEASAPKPSPKARPSRWRSFARVATLAAAAATVAVTSFVAGKDHFAAPNAKVRRAGTPTLKPVENGGYVRWQSDAVDVVIDKSFSDLAGDDLFGAAMNAWRASGAALPAVSTLPGEGRKVGYDPNGPNDNVVVYAPEGWERAHGALAVTVLTYDEGTGRILDADLLVNGGGRYFERFDRDESNESDAPVSIENGSSVSSGGGASHFDLQSVVTHEVGHFFGLGEDYDNTRGTMYIATRPGEIHKRVLSVLDSDTITALYAAASPDAQGSRGGCGRAELAPSQPAPSSWIGFAAAGLGLALLAASRRSRSAELRVRAVAPRRRAGRVARFGGWLTAFGLGLFLAPPELEAATDAPVVRGDADVQVVTAAPRWNDGIVETELIYRVTTCHVARCPEGDQRAVVAGGTIGGVTQVVGPFAVPRQGARLRVELRDHRSFYQHLNPTFQP
jgi:hypothetical protein